MIMQYRYWVLTASAALPIGLFLQACGDDSGTLPHDAATDGIATDATTDGTADARNEGGDAGDSSTPPKEAGEAGEAGPGSDAGDAGDAGGPVPVFLAHFDSAHLPEGLWILGDGGPPIVGYTALATLATVTADGGTQLFGTIGDAGAAANANTLGITTDVNGNVYVGVGSLTPDAGPVPAPGVYRFPSDGGAGTLFSSAPGMTFANGLDFIGNTLFVADSTGVIYAIDSSGNASAWSNDPLLAPDAGACEGGVSAPIGANGIVHDTNNVYVTNTNYGRIVKIPIGADGGPGAATALVESCAMLTGADGLVLDTKDQSLLVAVNIQNKIARVSSSGQASVVTSGGPLDFPASVVIESDGGARRLLFTNASLFTPPDAGRPGVLALPIP
jgi:sugar lactone lactonase YvrE